MYQENHHVLVVQVFKMIHDDTAPNSALK